MLIDRIISGGQTGADRAALDTAIEWGVQHGGWVPQGRAAEDGPLSSQYCVRETPGPNVSQRTEWNVRDADATLIISHGQLVGGSKLTQQMTCHYEKPFLHVDLAALSIPEAAERITHWLSTVQAKTLNVAGARHSEDLQIYQKTRELLELVLSIL